MLSGRPKSPTIVHQASLHQAVVQHLRERYPAAVPAASQHQTHASRTHTMLIHGGHWAVPSQNTTRPKARTQSNPPTSLLRPARPHTLLSDQQLPTPAALLALWRSPACQQFYNANHSVGGRRQLAASPTLTREDACKQGRQSMATDRGKRLPSLPRPHPHPHPHPHPGKRASVGADGRCDQAVQAAPATPLGTNVHLSPCHAMPIASRVGARPQFGVL